MGFQWLKAIIADKNMKNQILTQVKEAIKDWDTSDIYAVSLWVQDNDDNPCEPIFWLGYNTETHYQKQIPNASGKREARWNFAFWLQNDELVFGEDDTQKIVQDWIIQKGYSYYTYDEMFGNQNIDKDSYEGITNEFVNVLIKVVKELHKSGFVTKAFGKKIPIIIHELEYYDKIAEQNIEANSREIMGDECIECCRGYY